MICRVTENRPLAGGFFYLSVEPEQPVDGIRPGSFVMIRCSTGLEPYLRRPMSVADFSPDGSRFGLLIQKVGRGTTLLEKLVVGDPVDIIGPYGRATFEAPVSDENIWIVAGGTGLAPFLGLLENSEDCSNIKMFIGARTSELIFFEERFRATGVEVIVATEDGSSGYHGLVTGAIEESIGNNDLPVKVYSCGPTPMMAAVKKIAGRIGVDCYLSLENRMACGFGACLGCVQRRADRDDYVTVCRKGPVFEAREILL